MASKKAEHIRRMWDEVSAEPLPQLIATGLATELTAEELPTDQTEHKGVVMSAALAAAAERRRSQAAGASHDRMFRQLLDQGTAHIGTWRLFDAIRPQLVLLSWTYWVTAAILFALSALVFPQIAAWGPGALIVTVPLIAMVSLIYTVRAGRPGMRDWERSCPVTPFQIAMARTTLVLGITVAGAFLASLVLVRQELGISLAALTVSWLAPLLLIVGLYMAGDVVIGGMAGPAGALLAWFVHLAITDAGQTLSSIATSVQSVEVSTYDALTLAVGVLLLVISLFLTSKDLDTTHADRSA